MLKRQNRIISRSIRQDGTDFVVQRVEALQRRAHNGQIDADYETFRWISFSKQHNNDDDETTKMPTGQCAASEGDKDGVKERGAGGVAVDVVALSARRQRTDLLRRRRNGACRRARLRQRNKEKSQTQNWLRRRKTHLKRTPVRQRHAIKQCEQFDCNLRRIEIRKKREENQKIIRYIDQVGVLAEIVVARRAICRRRRRQCRRQNQRTKSCRYVCHDETERKDEKEKRLRRRQTSKLQRGAGQTQRRWL